MKTKQSISKELRYTVRDFDREFPNDDACLEYMAQKRWPGRITQCAKCGVERKHYRIKGRTAYSCDHCGTQIYPLAGTIFEKTTTPLKTWFYAMFLMGSTRCGISAKQIQRECGVTYKTAWRMFNQVRKLLSDGDMKLEGSTTVEMDETYMGGRRERPGRPHRSSKRNRCVIGMVERGHGGRVRAIVSTDGATRRVLHGMAKEYIMPASTIFTDEWASYNGLKQLGYRHKRIKHSAGVYVVGSTHTNTIEGFWSLVKRGIGGVYHSVSHKHLQSYLDEYSFRYNRRHLGNRQFRAILERAVERAS
jgi:transposase-like protein